jgi:SAM-dependent methyltransferase
MSGYKSFAWFYDRLIGNVDYKAMALQIDGYAKKFGGRQGGILLDLACGTGSLSEEFARLGYDVIGVDGSCDMLNAALDKKFESGLNIQYLCQDMRELDMYGTIDITVCTLDSINHLESEEDVKRVFERVSLFAYPDGMFIFDVNTLKKHRDILSDNAYIYSLDGLYCGWQNEYNQEDNSVGIYLDFFEQTENGYERFSEEFREIYISEDSIKNLLKDTGFEILAVYDDYSEKNPSENTERLVYVCRKKNTDNTEI